MKVLFAIAHLDKGGGQAVQAAQLFARLAPDVQGELVCLSSGRGVEMPVPPDRVSVVGRLRFPLGILDLARAIRERLSSYDLVQVFDPYFSLPAARLARAEPIVVRFGAHPTLDLASRYGVFGRSAMGAVIPWLVAGTTVVVNAPHLSAGFRGQPSVVIPNGVDISRFPVPRDVVDARTELGLPLDVPIVCYTGKIIRRKGIEELYWLLRALPSVHLLLVGSDSEPYYGDQFHREIRADYSDVLSRVHHFAEVPPTQVPRVLEAADLFVFPSRLEGMPNSILEAMAAGLPVVARDTAAHRAVVGSDIGQLYASPPELASYVWALLNDPVRRHRMGTQAREVARRDFSLDAARDAYLRLYESILEELHSSGRPLGSPATQATRLPRIRRGRHGT